ncbi:hypothetical protein BLNAU_4581 [Blattamonas nauphoetae]|uniref:Uncharacterized protein n=1 Tax=Blattamonas nauphoetae TaxID=2049346 RepID=A0ABQ9Y9N1_9EUKA|nr:hypothetical protein BLNAU_4581 [Blattamonas nauphoetae]
MIVGTGDGHLGVFDERMGQFMGTTQDQKELNRLRGSDSANTNSEPIRPPATIINGFMNRTNSDRHPVSDGRLFYQSEMMNRSSQREEARSPSQEDWNMDSLTSSQTSSDEQYPAHIEQNHPTEETIENQFEDTLIRQHRTGIARIPMSLYTLSLNPSRTQLMLGGGPIYYSLSGHYVGVW